MKRAQSQIAVAIVCCLLGFLLAYQFKVHAKENAEETNYISNDVLAEIESLKKEKEELVQTNASLSEELKKMEESVANDGKAGEQLKNQLDTTRIQLGLVDVCGPGIEISITTKNSLFDPNSSSTNLGETELAFLVNTLWFAGAEAISINDIRITPQTGIKNSGEYVAIGTVGRIDPSKDITIKAIGSPAVLKESITFGTTSKYQLLKLYNVDVKEVKDEDGLILEKSTQSLKSDYVKKLE